MEEWDLGQHYLLLKITYFHFDPWNTSDIVTFWTVEKLGRLSQQIGHSLKQYEDILV